MAVETLQEYACSAGLKIKVDRERGVIPGVKVLGLQSANGRTYSKECAVKAIPLYEQSAVFVDHQKKGELRSYHDRIGHLVNVSARDDGLFADLHFNPKHALAEQLIWDAEQAPESVGFSHDVLGKTVKKDGKVIVESISKVNSVDLVAKPATTASLFESEELPTDAEQRELCEHGLSAITDARMILLGDEAIETKKVRLTEILATWREELGGAVEPTNKEKSTMEWKDITRESLTENRKDLVELLTGTDATSKLNAKVTELTESITAKDAALKEATDKLAAADAEKAKQAKTLAITEELKDAKLDASDKVAVSEAFMETLNSAADADARKRLIEDRVALTKRHAAPGTAAPFASVGTIPAAVAQTKQEFMGRI